MQSNVRVARPIFMSVLPLTAKHLVQRRVLHVNDFSKAYLYYVCISIVLRTVAMLYLHFFHNNDDR